MEKIKDIYNGWKVHKPEWNSYSKHICTKEHRWIGVFANSFYINNKVDKILIDYPNIADHFYYLYNYNGCHADVIFGSYDLDEVKRFIEYHKIKNCYIYDAVYNEKIKIN